jgi:hypothetical protein
MSSSSYAIPVGGSVGGGGASQSGTYKLAGGVQLSGGTISASDDYVVAGGVVSAVYSGLRRTIGRPGTLPDASYQMVSVPVGLAGSNTVAAVFGDDLGAADNTQWRLFSYRAGTLAEYPSAAPVDPGHAYWLIARGGKSYGANGYTVVPNRIVGGINYFQVALDSGWNQLGNPLPYAATWADVLFDDNGAVGGHIPAVLDDVAHRYTGSGYQPVTSIPAWEGVFVFIKKTGVKALIRFDSAPAPVRSLDDREAVAAADGWTVRLRLTADNLVDDANFIGVRSDALIGEDYYDYSKPPAPPEGAQMALRLPEGDQRARRADYRPPFADGAIWQVTLPDVTGRKFAALDLDNIPGDMTAKLVLDVGVTYDLTDGVDVALPNDAKSARLVIGTSAFAASEVAEILPKVYALHQNFPNPFNPETSIRFALPEQTRLRLSIFNVLGQRVRVLADGMYPAGLHDVVWDGKNEQGSAVGSGAYFYRIESSAFNQTHKMLMLK